MFYMGEGMKKISVLIPCFNEVENVEGISEAVEKVLVLDLSDYDYEIVFIDNASTDGTREKIERICENNRKIKAIFNVTNFGQFNSPFYGMCALDGDCVIPICADFQDPVELRLCTMAGFVIALIDVIVALVYLVLKLTHWYNFHAGYAPMIIGMFMMGAVQLIFIGLMGNIFST